MYAMTIASACMRFAFIAALHFCFIFVKFLIYLRIVTKMSCGNLTSSVEVFSVCGTGHSLSQIVVYEVRKNVYKLMRFLTSTLTKLKQLHIYLEGNTLDYKTNLIL